MVLMVATGETSAWMRKMRYFSASNKRSSLQRDSWQERFFAEDSSDPLCGCIWHSRCYSCSFCKKEFKSAQALGGHMNVHRRDRARLRQSPSSHSTVNQHPCGSQHAYQRPPGVCSMVIRNPKSRSGHSSPQTDPNPYGAEPQSSVPGATASCCIDSRKHASGQHSSCRPTSLCDPLSKISCGFNLNAAEELKSRTNLHCDVSRQELAIGSADCLLGRKTLDGELLGTYDDDTAKRKRPRSCSTDALAWCSRKNAPPDRLHSVLFGQTQSAIEDLDLELRLGVRPKVV